MDPDDIDMSGPDMLPWTDAEPETTESEGPSNAQ